MSKLEKRTKLKTETKFSEYFKLNWGLYLIILPSIIYIFIFNYYPMSGLQLAFKDWRIMKGIWGSPWAMTDGQLDLFKHFKTLLGTVVFQEKLLNTLRISFLKLLCGFPIPIILAIFFNEMSSDKYKKSIQAISYLPHFISWVIIAGIINSMTQSGTGFQTFLKSIFGKEIYFFSSDDLFVFIIVLSSIWKGCGWGTIIYFAAITGIDPQLYEAADIDGANRWKKIWFITLPSIKNAISINLIFSLSDIMSAGFDQIYNMINPAVYGKGDVLETYLFRIGISGGKYDQATAVGLFNSLIGLLLVIVANKLSKLVGADGIW